MKTTKLLILTCVLLLNTVYAQENSTNDNTANAYEMPRTQVIQISNSETDALNTLYIKLPDGYEKNKHLKYPVIYFTSPVQHIEILSALTESLLEDVIIVGLSWPKGMNFGNLDSYVNDFLRQDVFKMVESKYRADAERRTFFGYSWGGVVGAYILSNHPNTFKNFILGSPDLGVDHEVIQKIYKLESTTAEERKKLNANVFISYGILEEKDTPHFEKFITMLKSINDESLTLQHIVVEGNHQTAMPMTAIRSMYWLSDLIKVGDFPHLEDRYFNQKLPGLIPELFAPGIIATEKYKETVVTFLPDMTEFEFKRSGGKYKRSTLFVMQYKNNKWSRKSILPADRSKYQERFHPAKSEMRRHEMFKDIPITGLTVSPKGTYYFYFIDFQKGGTGHMSYSRLINGKYETPIKMNESINTGKYIAHPFIAPDESYLMWDAEIEGQSTPDIFISFRKKDGSWGSAINMGDKINTAAYEQRPRVTPDGKYLFFWRGDKKLREDGSTYWEGNPYWLDVQFIETLRPKE